MPSGRARAEHGPRAAAQPLAELLPPEPQPAAAEVESFCTGTVTAEPSEQKPGPPWFGHKIKSEEVEQRSEAETGFLSLLPESCCAKALICGLK